MSPLAELTALTIVPLLESHVPAGDEPGCCCPEFPVPFVVVVVVVVTGSIR